MSLKAVGLHVFAGGFTQGVKRVFNVEQQYEVWDFGKQSVEQLGVEWVRRPDGKWPVDKEAQFLYGNPRCTAFSTCTAGSCTAHGAFAPQTVDIVQLMEHGIGNYDVVVWESVQQAISTGRPLLDLLVKEHIKGKGYKVAHVMLNAATFGNPQNRKRYFFVAYRDNLVFNVEPPKLEHACSFADKCWEDMGRPTRKVALGRKEAEYDRDCYPKLSEDNTHSLLGIPSQRSLNWMADNHFEGLHQKQQDVAFMSDKRHPFMGAFSLHRMGWERHCPTIHGCASVFIHPWLHRSLTVGEFAKCMGWDDVIPIGPNPIGQLAKGVVPELGEWLANQVKDCLNGRYAKSDDVGLKAHRNGHIEYHDRDGLEKMIDMTNYVAPLKKLEDYDLEVQRHVRIHPVNNFLEGEPLAPHQVGQHHKGVSTLAETSS